MGAHSIGVLVVAAGVLGVLVWLLAKLGRLLASIAEAVRRGTRLPEPSGPALSARAVA
jgi:hypothetical protein